MELQAWLVKILGVILVWLCHVLQIILHFLYFHVPTPLAPFISWRRKERRNDDRRNQEKVERKRAVAVAQKFVDGSNGLYSQLQAIEDMGSRMQKMWFQMEGEEGSKIMTVAPVSTKCPFKLEKSVMKTFNKLLLTIKHPLIQDIEKVEYHYETGNFIIVQPLMSRGSLKDLIYKASPLSDWSVKYVNCVTPYLQSADIASYGRQILEGIFHLYEFGLRPLGHIQTGNIYIERETQTCRLGGYENRLLGETQTCRLGGYENRLLGYKTRIYNMCEKFDCCEEIDVIMFGCIIFEMACGYELTGVSPSKHDYESVKSEMIRDVLIFIFRRNEQGRFLTTMEEILALEFFQEAHLPHLDGAWSDHTSLTRSMRNLISKVVKGKEPPYHISLMRSMRNFFSKVVRGKPRKHNPPKPCVCSLQ